MIDFKNTTVGNIWWITKSVDDEIIHYGILESEMLLQSGLATLETFDNETEWLQALGELNINIEE